MPGDAWDVLMAKIEAEKLEANMKTYALAEDHYNVHREDYDTVWTPFREQDMNGVTGPEEIAAELLKTFITESHQKHNGEPVSYSPADKEYRVRIFSIDPAILVQDDLGDEALPDGFQPDGAPVAVATWQVNDKN